MRKKRKTNHSYSLVKNMKLAIVGAVIIIIVNFIISLLSIINIRQQNYEAIQNSVTLYQNELSSKFDSIEHFIQWTVVKEPLLEAIEKADNLHAVYELTSALRTRVTDNQYATGKKYQYFAYLKRQDFFFNASDLDYSYSDYLAIKKHIITTAKSRFSVDKNYTWQFVTLNDSTYLYYMITYYNRTFAAFINVEDIVAPLQSIDLGNNGELAIMDLEGHYVYHDGISTDVDNYHKDSFFYSLHTFHGSEYALPFDISVYCDNFNNFGRLFFFQLFIIFTALVLCITLAGFILHLYYKVIKPIQEFSATLADINEHEDIINFQSNSIRELEQASIQFKNLIHEIKRLKIDIYEHELDKKRFQITFLQNQIRPHFYLNCLTTISSMAQLGNYKDIESMVLFTSRYLRYLFQTDKEMIQIEYELTHIEAYLDIQELRFGSVFQYTCIIEEQDKHALIPPLLLITFIENTLKHSNARNEQLLISLTVKRKKIGDKDYLKIDIIDSGQGFPQLVLDKLSQGESLNADAQSHVGITNSMQRLNLLYGSDQKLRFFNEPNGGAHIQLFIPYQT